jgi:hypothetical protein
MSNKQIKFKISNFKLFFICLLINLLIGLFAYSVKVQAQVSRTLTVVPPTQDLKAKPGKQVQTTVKVRNETNEPITVKARTKDFLVFDDKGTPTFVEEEVSGRWSLSSWMIVSPTEYTIAPRSSKMFDLVILVPEDALPGGHYASVYFTPVEGGLAPGVSGTGIETKLASLIKLVVEGPVTEMAYVRKFFAPRFSEFGPIKIQTQIENQSDLDITPKGLITVKDLLGRTIASFKIEERRIFPFAIRSFENTIEKKWLFGRYKATLTGTYGTTGQALIAYLTFWVIPWKIITVVILALAILVLAGYWIGKKKAEKQETL